jgi:hypothetical protein
MIFFILSAIFLLTPYLLVFFLYIRFLFQRNKYDNKTKSSKKIGTDVERKEWYNEDIDNIVIASQNNIGIAKPSKKDIENQIETL